MNSRVLLLCVALVACKSGPAAKPASSADVTAYYPLAVGNSWTYELSGTGDEPRRETVKIVGQDGGWFLDDHRGRLRYESDGIRDSDRYLLRAPLESGGTWKAVADLMVQKFEVTSADATLVTQAGTFTHCAVVRNEQPVPKGGKFVTEWTYAPKVGMVQLRTAVQDAQGREKQQTKLVLVSYSVK